jgi:hypothetical protein
MGDERPELPNGKLPFEIIAVGYWISQESGVGSPKTIL